MKSDLLSLLPSSASQPEVDLATRHVAGAAGNRIFLLAEAGDSAGADAAGAILAERLRGCALLEQVLLDVPKPDLAELRDRVAASWGRLPLGEASLADRLDRRLNASFPDPLAPAIQRDPYGVATDWLHQVPWPASGILWDAGRLRTHADGRAGVLVIARVRAENPSLSEQEAIARACGEAVDAARACVPGLTVAKVGGVFHAAAAQAGARRDVDLVGWGSVAGILLLMIGVFRSPRMLLLCGGSILAGVAAATSVTFLAYGEIHLLTLVFGTSLLGEAADYSIQLSTARIARPDDPAWTARVTPGLTFALGTSLIGYAASALVPLPLVRQISAFAMAGITAAYLYIRLVGPATLEPAGVGRAPITAGWLAARIEALLPRVRAGHLGAAAVLAVAGFAVTALLPADDDVRHLIRRDPALARDEERLLALTGDRPALPFLVLLPPERTDETNLRLAEDLAPTLAELRVRGAIGRWQSLDQLCPSDRNQARREQELREAWHSQSAEVRPLLEATGLGPPPATFAPLELGALLGTTGGYPFRLLRLQTDTGPLHLVRFQGDVDADRLAAAFRDNPSVAVVDKAGAVSRSLTDLRRLWPLWLGLTLALCHGLLSVRYGARRAARLLLPICLGLAWACPLAALAGTPMSIFSLLALTLVLGVGVNYGIFLAEGGLGSAAALSGVLASAATTLISFGLLGFVSMPALSWLGTTLGAGILLSLLATPLALSDGK